MTTFYPLEKIANVHDGYKKAFSIKQHHILLIQHEGTLSLLESYCPHAGFPMIDSKIIDGNLRCQMHGYLFDLISGECHFSSEGPCRGLKVYELVYQDDELGVIL